MKPLISTMAIFLIATTISTCMTTNDAPATIKLTSDRIALAASDTTGSVDASLSCNCPCTMQNMMVTGDTGMIHFNLAEMQNNQEVTHHIVAIANPANATSDSTYTCTFTFMMHDPMVMGGMQDYHTSVTAIYRR